MVERECVSRRAFLRQGSVLTAGVVYAPYTLKSKTKPASLTALDPTQLYEPQDQEWSSKDTREGLFEVARRQDVGVITTKPFSAGLIFSAAGQEFGQPDRA